MEPAEGKRSLVETYISSGRRGRGALLSAFPTVVRIPSIMAAVSSYSGCFLPISLIRRFSLRRDLEESNHRKCRRDEITKNPNSRQRGIANDELAFSQQHLVECRGVGPKWGQTLSSVFEPWTPAWDRTQAPALYRPIHTGRSSQTSFFIALPTGMIDEVSVCFDRSGAKAGHLTSHSEIVSSLSE